MNSFFFFLANSAIVFIKNKLHVFSPSHMCYMVIIYYETFYVFEIDKLHVHR